jgi:hypothetical protein
MKIFLDDIREVTMSHNPNKGLGIVTDFVIVRNDKDFIKLVDENINQITLVSFDHDLACFNDDNEFTGKTACEYLIDKLLEVGRKFPDWYVHSDNTSGRENIIGLILNYLRKIEGVDTSDYKYFHRGMVNGKFV